MKNKGFTLIELAVVLAVISILAAILTPLVTGYLERARESRALADIRTIADAIKLYKTDTGVYPFFDTSAQANSGKIADIAGGTSVVAVNSNGGCKQVTDTLWTGSYLATTSLEAYANANVMNLGKSVRGRVGFNGPYVSGIDPDGWGNCYYVEVDNLGSDATNWAFVVSPGPNGTITTSKTQPKTGQFVAADDDIAVGIR